MILKCRKVRRLKGNRDQSDLCSFEQSLNILKTVASVGIGPPQKAVGLIWQESIHGHSFLNTGPQTYTTGIENLVLNFCSHGHPLVGSN